MSDNNNNTTTYTKELKMIGYGDNIVNLSGYVVGDIKFHHTLYGERIYKFYLKVTRSNHTVDDILPIEVSDRAVDVSLVRDNQLVSVNGSFRSFNKMNSDSKKVSLELSVFAKDVILMNTDNSNTDNNTYIHENSVTLRGKICKEPVFRITPSGREIGDILLEVSRVYGKKDYLPCIAWSRNARYVSTLSIGTELLLKGRLQSRQYIKHFDDGNTIERTVYEVSVSELNVIKKSNKQDNKQEQENTQEDNIENTENNKGE